MNCVPRVYDVIIYTFASYWCHEQRYDVISTGVEEDDDRTVTIVCWQWEMKVPGNVFGKQMLDILWLFEKRRLMALSFQRCLLFSFVPPKRTLFPCLIVILSWCLTARYVTVLPILCLSERLCFARDKQYASYIYAEAMYSFTSQVSFVWWRLLNMTSAWYDAVNVHDAGVCIRLRMCEIYKLVSYIINQLMDKYFIFI